MITMALVFGWPETASPLERLAYHPTDECTGLMKWHSCLQKALFAYRASEIQKGDQHFRGIADEYACRELLAVFHHRHTTGVDL